MLKYKNQLLAVLLSALLVSLSGCDTKNIPLKKDNSLKPLGDGYHFTTDKGLDCYYFDGGYDGGLSCNWQKLNKEQKAN